MAITIVELESAMKEHLEFMITWKPDHLVELTSSFWGSLIVEDIIDAD